MRTIWRWLRAAGVLLSFAVQFLLGFFLFDSKAVKWALGALYGGCLIAVFVALFVKHP